MMKCRTLAFLFSLIAIACLHGAGPVRIQFQRGHTSAEVAGHFTSKVTEELYVLRASSGQHMKVEIEPRTGNIVTAGTVTSPSGKSDGAPGGVIFDSDLTETGDYVIRVYERQERLAGTFTVRVEIK